MSLKLVIVVKYKSLVIMFWIRKIRNQNELSWRSYYIVDYK